MQYISDGGCTISDRPVLLSSGPVWCSSSLIISDSGAEPLGMEGIFLFSCGHEIETTKCKRLKKEQQHRPVNPVAPGWLLAVIKPTTFWIPLLSHNHYSTTAPTPYLDSQAMITWDGTLLGGSIRIVGSHSPGGSTVTWSKNSSMPDRRSFLSLALYATSWKICHGVREGKSMQLCRRKWNCCNLKFVIMSKDSLSILQNHLIQIKRLGFNVFWKSL